MVNFTTPNTKSSAEYMRELITQGLETRYGNPIPEHVKERADHEFEAIENVDLVDIFLIVHDFIDWAINHGIPISPGRGALAGSIINYALGITNIDPLQYNLFFERFLNVDGSVAPCFAIDFGANGRSDVINYMREKYGKRLVARQCSYNEWAMIIELGPLEIELLEMDSLTVLDTCMQSVNKRYADLLQRPITLEDIPLDDKRTFELLQRGDCLGLYPFDEEGMDELLIKANPETFEQLVALYSLYRPGPMHHIPEYLRRKIGYMETEYIHETLEPILHETYGLFIYQEQIMDTAQTLAGFTLNQADLMRRALGKKKVSELKEWHDLFVNGCRSIGHDMAHQIFNELERVSAYSFNKAHAVAYTTIAYQLAYMKAHYSIDFYAALLSTDAKTGGKNRDSYLNAIRNQGLEFTFDTTDTQKLVFWLISRAFWKEDFRK